MNPFHILGRMEPCRTANRFVKATWFDPLVASKDVLAGRHANT